MKKLLLVLLICVVIDSGKEVFNAGRIITSKVVDFRLSDSLADTPEHSDDQKQIVLNILLLPNECHCPR